LTPSAGGGKQGQAREKKFLGHHLRFHIFLITAFLGDWTFFYSLAVLDLETDRKLLQVCLQLITTHHCSVTSF